MTILFSKARELFEKDYQEQEDPEQQEVQPTNTAKVGGENSEFGKSDAAMKHQSEEQ